MIIITLVVLTIAIKFVVRHLTLFSTQYTKFIVDGTLHKYTAQRLLPRNVKTCYKYTYCEKSKFMLLINRL